MELARGRGRGKALLFPRNTLRSGISDFQHGGDAFPAESLCLSFLLSLSPARLISIFFPEHPHPLRSPFPPAPSPDSHFIIVVIINFHLNGPKSSPSKVEGKEFVGNRSRSRSETWSGLQQPARLPPGFNWNRRSSNIYYSARDFFFFFSPKQFLGVNN